MSETVSDRDRILVHLTAHDVYGSDLKKAGKNMVMCCPFHEEKTASFHVYPDLGFHCFGCGKTGDVFKFAMDKENISFPEALKLLGAKVGITIGPSSSSDPSARQYMRMFEMNAVALELYAEILTKKDQGQAAMAYLTNRGLTQESIDTFKLGYTPGGVIRNHLREKGFTETEIESSGLVNEFEGRALDRFYRRVMFPIMKHGRVLGFGGQKMEDGEYKYINSPATPIFHKSAILYGLDPKAIKAAGYALVVEGYLDVVMCHQHGHKNVAAPLGTALTEHHIEVLKKYTNWVLVVLDGDKAGNEAAERAASMLFADGMRGAVLLLPAGEDPDSYLRKGNSFAPLIERAIPFSVFLAKSHPERKRMIFDALLHDGTAAEMAEFLGHKGTQLEGEIFGELKGRQFAQQFFDKAPMIYREKDAEVRMSGDYLGLFYRKRFFSYLRVNGDYKKQAADMAASILKPKKKAERIRTTPVPQEES